MSGGEAKSDQDTFNYKDLYKPLELPPRELYRTDPAEYERRKREAGKKQSEAKQKRLAELGDIETVYDKFRCDLALSLYDYLKGGVGTPPNEILEAGPNKTKADLMSDNDIGEYLDRTKKFIKRDPNPLDDYQKMSIDRMAQQYKINLQYLNSINRLPEQFKDDLPPQN